MTTNNSQSHLNNHKYNHNTINEECNVNNNKLHFKYKQQKNHLKNKNTFSKLHNRKNENDEYEKTEELDSEDDDDEDGKRKLIEKTETSDENSQFSIQSDDLIINDLSSSSSSSSSYENERYIENEDNWLKTELRELLRLCWPVVVSNLSTIIMQNTDIIFAGHLGSDILAGATLMNSWAIGTGFIAWGLTTALDTQVSQAFGSRNYEQTAEAFVRASVIITIACFPVAAAWWFTPQFLIAVGEMKNVASIAGTFARVLLSGLWFRVMFQVIQSWLSGQHITKPPMIVGIFVMFLNILFNFVFIYGIGSWSGLGYVGAPLATALSRIIQTLLLVGIVIYLGLHKPIIKSGFSRHTLSPSQIWQFLKLGVPGALVMALEEWGFEGTTLMAGYLESEEILSAHSVLMNIVVVIWFIGLSIGIAAAIRVGSFIGRGDAIRAKRTAAATIGVETVLVLLFCIILLIVRRHIAFIFSSDETVIKLVDQYVYLISALQIFDGLATVFQGILRGQGKQYIGTFTYFVGFYLVGLPVSACLCFVAELGLSGLWLGIILGLVVIDIIFAINLLLTDWQKLTQKVRERIKRESSLRELDQSNILSDENDDEDDTNNNDVANQNESQFQQQQQQQEYNRHDEQESQTIIFNEYNIGENPQPVLYSHTSNSSASSLSSTS